MKLIDKMIFKRLLKSGYNNEQADLILSIIAIYPKAINYMSADLNIHEIKQIGEFFASNDAPSIAYIAGLEPKKRIMMVEAYNKFVKSDKSHLVNIFKLLYSIACEYDAPVLKIAINKTIDGEIDYEFLNIVQNKMDAQESLLDLDYFKELEAKEVIKK